MDFSADGGGPAANEPQNIASCCGAGTCGTCCTTRSGRTCCTTSTSPMCYQCSIENLVKHIVLLRRMAPGGPAAGAGAVGPAAPRARQRLLLGPNMGRHVHDISDAVPQAPAGPAAGLGAVGPAVSRARQRAWHLHRGLLAAACHQGDAQAARRPRREGGFGQPPDSAARGTVRRWLKNSQSRTAAFVSACSLCAARFKPGRSVDL